MSILYLEHKNFLIVKVATRITDLTGDRDLMLQSARLPPSLGELMLMRKDSICLLLEPWHAGWSFTSQTKPYLAMW